MVKKSFLVFKYVILIIFGVVLGVFSIKYQSGVDGGELVVEVVDGDTFIIENRQPIRLYGLDAPELENCYGKEAKEKLKQLVFEKRVLVKEPLSDKTGRVMALVYVDGVLVNELMVKEGYGVYRRQAGSATDLLKAANEYARENSLGIFSSECYQKEPEDGKCNIKGNIEEREGRKIYFLPECANYDQVIIEKFQGESWFCSEKEAKEEGFSKSATCY